MIIDIENWPIRNTITAVHLVLAKYLWTAKKDQKQFAMHIRSMKKWMYWIFLQNCFYKTDRLCKCVAVPEINSVCWGLWSFILVNAKWLRMVKTALSRKIFEWKPQLKWMQHIKLPRLLIQWLLQSPNYTKSTNTVSTIREGGHVLDP